LAQQQYRYYGKIEEPDFLTTDSIFESEMKILQGIAADESCIIAGRSGFYVFRNHPNHLSILIQAPLEQRIARLVKQRGISTDEAEDTIRKVDKMRENYVQRYTGTSRYDTRNYDLVISMNGKTEEQAVDLILGYIG
jgi:cytidylate kinase